MLLQIKEKKKLSLPDPIPACLEPLKEKWRDLKTVENIFLKKTFQLGSWGTCSPKEGASR